MKIKTKLSLIFTIFSLFGMLVILSVAFYNADTETISVSKNHLSAIAEIQKNRVNELINKDLELLNQIKNRTGIVDDVNSLENKKDSTVLANLDARLKDAKNSSQRFDDIAIYNRKGELLTSSNPEINVEDYYDVDELKDEISQNKIEISYKNDRKLIIHGPIIKDGSILGTLLIISDTSNFQAIMHDYSGLGETGETAIVGRTEEGDVVYLDAPRFGSIETIVPKENVNVPAVQALKQNEAIFTDLVDYRNHPVYAVTKYIPEVDWGLVVKKDKSEIFQPIYSNARTLGIISLLLVAVSFMISFMAASTLSRPITGLRKGAEEIEKGNLSYRVAMNRKDEIGQLSQSFDRMANSLKESKQEIEAKVADRTKDLEKINQAMVGRELKMIELKKEIASLKTESSSDIEQETKQKK